MESREKRRMWRLRLIAVFVCFGLGIALRVSSAAAESAPRASQAPVARAVGTIKSISGKSIVLTNDSGAEITVEVADNARLIRLEPGAKDLKNAAVLQLQEL
ncbi:MAG: hypothetical protein ACRD51_04595, partial [Candidatus Acidiferrum sp.]